MQQTYTPPSQDVLAESVKFLNEHLTAFSELGLSQAGESREAERARSVPCSAWYRDAGSARLAWALSALSQ